MTELRRAAALVAHVLHTPVPALDDAEIGELLAWADDATDLVGRLYRKSRG